MDEDIGIKEFITNQSVEVSLSSFAANLIFAAFLAYLLSLLYERFGQSLSNRKLFSKNLIFLTMTTMLVISIVKSSLALSLGLVGALSIVRFRAAIKEPEELVYLFLAISIGLGFGANQGVVTTLAFVIISGMVVLTNLNKKPVDYQNLHLSVSCEGGPKLELSNVVKIINENCSKVLLKRYDDHQNVFQSIFLVEIDTIEELETIKSKLQETNETARITYVENKGIF
tara:strand:- start:14 stop:697 length:684 start_codon:yes stop_codon:yes gene_type:complete